MAPSKGKYMITDSEPKVEFSEKYECKDKPNPYRNSLTEDCSKISLIRGSLSLKDGDSKYKFEEREYAPDGGWGWVIVFASLMNNFVLDGVAFSYGVLTEDIKKQSKGVVGDYEFNLCGSAMLGMTLVVGPFVSVLIDYFGFRILSIAGSLLSCVGFLVAWGASPEVPEFWSIFIGFGILTGVGFGFMFTTSIVIVGLYFDNNRPLATGIAVTGSAVGSFVMPLVIETIMNTWGWGWQGVFKVLAGCCLISAFFGALYLPLPKRVTKVAVNEYTDKAPEKKKSGLTEILQLLASPTYLCLSIAGGITVLGYFVPSAFLRDKALEEPFNATSEEATWLPATIGGSNAIGRVFFGLLANSERATYSLLLTNVALTLGGIATILSVYATKYYQLLIYAIIYGQIIAIYASLRSIIVMDFLGEEKFSLGFGLSLFFMGISSFFGNSLAGWLIELTGNSDLSFLVTGGIFLLSAVLCYPLRLIHAKEKEIERKSGRRWISTVFKRGSISQP